MGFRKISLEEITRLGGARKRFWSLPLWDDYVGFVQAVCTKGKDTFYAEGVFSLAEAEELGEFKDSRGLPYTKYRLEGVEYGEYDTAYLENDCWSAAMGRLHQRRIESLFESLPEKDPALLAEFRAWYKRNRARIEERIKKYRAHRRFGKKVRLSEIERSIQLIDEEPHLGLSSREAEFFEAWFVSRLKKKGFGRIKSVKEGEQAVKEIVAKHVKRLEKAGFERSPTRLFRFSDHFYEEEFQHPSE